LAAKLFYLVGKLSLRTQSA